MKEKTNELAKPLLPDSMNARNAHITKDHFLLTLLLVSFCVVKLWFQRDHMVVKERHEIFHNSYYLKAIHIR